MSWGKKKSEDLSVVPSTTGQSQEVRLSKESLFWDWGYNFQYLSSPSNVSEEELHYLQQVLSQNLDLLFPKNNEIRSDNLPDVKKSKNCAVALRTANYSKTVYVCLEKPNIKKVPDSRPKNVAKPDYANWAKEYAENWAKFDAAAAKEWANNNRAKMQKYRETHGGQDPFDVVTEQFDRQYLIVDGIFFFNVAADLRPKFVASGFTNEWQINLEIEIPEGKSTQNAINDVCMQICKQIADKRLEIRRLSEFAGSAILENSESTTLLAKELGAKKALEVLAESLGAFQKAVKNAADDLEGKSQENAAKRIAAVGSEIAKAISR